MYFHQINCFIDVNNIINKIIANDKANPFQTLKKCIDILNVRCVLTKDVIGLVYLVSTVTNHAHPTVKTTRAT